MLRVQGRGGGAANGGAPAAAAAAAGSDSLTVTEQQVAKLMEEDMGTAMQYLQGKGLCLMPISLASAISSATCHLRPPVVAAAAAQQFPAGLGAAAAAAHHHQLSAAAAAAAAMRGHLPGLNADGSVPASPSMSVLTAQSAMANGGGGAADGEGSQLKDAASVSKP